MSRHEMAHQCQPRGRAGTHHGSDRLPAIMRLLLLILSVGSVLRVPLGQWVWLGVCALALGLVIGCCRVSWRSLLERWLRVAVVLVLLVLAIAPGHPARAELGLGSVILGLALKSLLAVGVVLVFVKLRGWGGLLCDLRLAGVPAVLVSTLYFLDRYRWVLGHERAKLELARSARRFRVSRGMDRLISASVITSLLIRSVERSDRITAAMEARGWDGTPRGLDRVWIER